MDEKSNMNTRIQELLKMLDEVDDFNREIIEKGSVKVGKGKEIKKEEKKVEVKRIMSPREIVKELDKTVIGHSEAKKQLATIFFKYLMERENYDEKDYTKSNVFISGASANGKTHLITELCRILNMDYIVVNCGQLSQSGYKGGDIEDELKMLYNKCDGDIDRLNKSVVILDEIGKCKPSKGGDGVDVGGEGVLKGLLKILENTEIEVERSSGYFKTKDSFSTKNIMFIGLDTLMMGEENIETIVRKRLDKSEIKTMGFMADKVNRKAEIHTRNEIRKAITLDDLISLGFSAEFVSRFNVLINLELLTREDFVKIAKLNTNGFNSYERIMSEYGKKLKVKEEVYEIFADLMSKTETGSRAVKGYVDKIMSEIIYDMVDNKKKKTYVVDTEMVNKTLRLEE